MLKKFNLRHFALVACLLFLMSFLGCAGCNGCHHEPEEIEHHDEWQFEEEKPQPYDPYPGEWRLA